MATKTVTMDGAEQRVDGLGGLNALIVNNTTEPLYASAKAGVVPICTNLVLKPTFANAQKICVFPHNSL